MTTILASIQQLFVNRRFSPPRLSLPAPEIASSDILSSPLSNSSLFALTPSASYEIDVGKAPSKDIVCSALMCVINNNMDELKILFKNEGFDINEQSKVYKLSALYVAVLNKNEKAFDIILNENKTLNLNVNIQTISGFTSLHIAVKIKCIFALEKILNSDKADSFLLTKKLKTSYMLAKKVGDNEVKEILDAHIKSKYMLNIQSEVNHEFEYLSKVLDSKPVLIKNFPKEMIIKKDKGFLDLILKSKLIQVTKGGILFNEELKEKIALARFFDSKVFITLVDFDFFNEYKDTKYVCPFLNLPFSDFVTPSEVENKVYILDLPTLHFIEQILTLNIN